MNETDSTTNTKPSRAVRFNVVNSVIIALGIILALGVLLVARAIGQTSDALEEATEVYIECEQAVSTMGEVSDYLTTQARMFVLTGEAPYLRRYLIEERDSQRREQAIDALSASTDDELSLQYLDNAMQASRKLQNREHYAMKLIVIADGISDEKGAKELESVKLYAPDELLSTEAKHAKAKNMLFDEDYQKSRDYIDRMVDQCEEALVDSAHASQEAAERRLKTYLLVQSALAILLLGVVLALTITHITLVLRPLQSFITHLNKNESFEVVGASELQRLARAYNTMYEENEQHKAHLVHKAQHDALTGLFNRSAYDAFCDEGGERQALVLVDIDYFKSINDKYGHDIGDEVLKAVAAALRDVFRSTDYPCRIGGDEFAIIMTNIDSSMRHVVTQRLNSIREKANSTAGLPQLTLSMGVAFSEDASGETSMYKAADIALYAVKEAGRNGHAFYADVRDSTGQEAAGE